MGDTKATKGLSLPSSSLQHLWEDKTAWESFGAVWSTDPTTQTTVLGALGMHAECLGKAAEKQ